MCILITADKFLQIKQAYIRESRILIEEQNAEYAESLRIDQEKAKKSEVIEPNIIWHNTVHVCVFILINAHY